jgi:molybdopterin-guanine dinucleotide biosynthesis protein
MHYNYIDIGPTTLKCIGMAVDKNNRVINTKAIHQHNMLPFRGAAASATKVILSLGSSMDSGKTTSAAYLVHGLKEAGCRVAFIKLTGTVYTKDCDLAADLGADMTADFSDMGFPSTYLCSEEELMNLYESLLVKVMKCEPDYVVMEIADGLYERETKMLLQNKEFKNSVEAVLFSAADSLAAINGVQVLNSWGIHPFAISGLLTASPLLVKEVQENTDIIILNIEQLSQKEVTQQFQKFENRMVSY